MFVGLPCTILIVLFLPFILPLVRYRYFDYVILAWKWSVVRYFYDMLVVGLVYVVGVIYGCLKGFIARHPGWIPPFSHLLLFCASPLCGW